MALKHIPTSGMLAHSKPIVDPASPERTALLAVPETAPFVSHVEAAHKAMVEIDAEVPDPSYLEALSAEQALLDRQHDDLRRGCYACLSGLAFLSLAPDKAEAYRRLRDRLFPGGLSETQQSYRDQAGNALLLEGRLDDATRAQLAAIQTPEGDLLTAVRQIISLGTRIGEIEQRKFPEPDKAPSKAGRAVAARNAWIRAIHALLSAIELSGTDDRAILGLRDRILRDADKAGRAAASSSPAPAQAEPVAEPVTEPA